MLKFVWPLLFVSPYHQNLRGFKTSIVVHLLCFNLNLDPKVKTKASVEVKDFFLNVISEGLGVEGLRRLDEVSPDGRRR